MMLHSGTSLLGRPTMQMAIFFYPVYRFCKYIYNAKHSHRIVQHNFTYFKIVLFINPYKFCPNLILD